MKEKKLAPPSCGADGGEGRGRGGAAGAAVVRSSTVFVLLLHLSLQLLDPGLELRHGDIRGHGGIGTLWNLRELCGGYGSGEAVGRSSLDV